MAKTSLAKPGAAARSLRSLLSAKRLVLTFTGRRSGTRYSTPVNYLQRGRRPSAIRTLGPRSRRS